MYSLLLFALVSAAQASAPETATAQKANAKEERKICRRIDATESRMASKRVCMTAADWKKASRDSAY